MAKAKSPAATRGRILVVEDEYLIALDIAMTLENLGYELVGPVSTLPEGSELIASEQLDAVLLDANLAGKSSAPLAAELTVRRIPFGVVTGYGHLELATAELEAAPRVTKPFTPADLAEKLSQAMGEGA